MPEIMVQNYMVFSEVQANSIVYAMRLTPLANVGSGNGVDWVQINYGTLQGGEVIKDTLTGKVAIVCRAPSAVFEIQYHIVQAEAPIFFEWATDSTAKTQLVFWRIRTGQGEFPGEGPIDVT